LIRLDWLKDRPQELRLKTRKKRKGDGKDNGQLHNNKAGTCRLGGGKEEYSWGTCGSHKLRKRKNLAKIFWSMRRIYTRGYKREKLKQKFTPEWDFRRVVRGLCLVKRELSFFGKKDTFFCFFLFEAIFESNWYYSTEGKKTRACNLIKVPQRGGGGGGGGGGGNARNGKKVVFVGRGGRWRNHIKKGERVNRSCVPQPLR